MLVLEAGGRARWACPSEFHGDGAAPPLRGDTPPEALPAAALGAAVVSVEFPAFNDGRGFSLAAVIRRHPAFKGRLRAVGQLLPDQIPAIFGAGFDEVVVSDTQLCRFGRAAWDEARARTTAPGRKRFARRR